ncbi:MAG: hypothetical protein ABSH07_11575 [Candidatus Dormibacteria bacterium]|jgi:hypothetical protein
MIGCTPLDGCNSKSPHLGELLEAVLESVTGPDCRALAGAITVEDEPPACLTIKTSLRFLEAIIVAATPCKSPSDN